MRTGYFEWSRYQIYTQYNLCDRCFCSVGIIGEF